MWSIVCNGGLLLFGIIGCVLELKLHKTAVLKYYTFQSNVLGTIAAALMLYGIFVSGEMIPIWILVFKLLATSCLTLTFVVVITVLAPMMGEGGYKFQLLEGNLKYQHLLCPLIAIASFVLCDYKLDFDIRWIIIAWLPTVIYAAVTIVLNIMKKLEGPYPFLEVYKQPWWASVLWCVGILTAQFIMVTVLLYVQSVIL
jgi:hypothetical protein